MNIRHATFSIENGELIVFTEQTFEGMVGETHSMYSACKLTDILSEEVRKVKLSYAQLQEIYRTDFLKYPRIERIQFWGHMQNMSPEAIARREEDERQEAISRVI